MHERGPPDTVLQDEMCATVIERTDEAHEVGRDAGDSQCFCRRVLPALRAVASVNDVRDAIKHTESAYRNLSASGPQIDLLWLMSQIGIMTSSRDECLKKTQTK